MSRCRGLDSKSTTNRNSGVWLSTCPVHNKSKNCTTNPQKNPQVYGKSTANPQLYAKSYSLLYNKSTTNRTSGVRACTVGLRKGSMSEVSDVKLLWRRRYRPIYYLRRRLYRNSVLFAFLYSGGHSTECLVVTVNDLHELSGGVHKVCTFWGGVWVS
jgi:hypothetical protein